MRNSPDDTLIFVTTADGCLFMFDMHVVEMGEIIPRKQEDPSTFLDVILVTRADLDEKRAAMQELENKIGEIQIQVF